MTQNRILFIALSLVLASLLTACSKKLADPGSSVASTSSSVASATEAAPKVSTAPDTSTAPVASSTAVSSDLHDDDGNPVPLLPFEIEKIALSNAQLGALPFFGLPQGYKPSKSMGSGLES